MEIPASEERPTAPPVPVAERPDVPYVPVELYRSAMVRAWGFLYYTVFWFFFRRLRLAEPSGERVRQAAEHGPVVYVLRTRSLVDYLALNEVLRRRRLPLADYGMAIQMTWYMPVAEAARLLKDKVVWFFKHGRLPNPVDVGWLSRLVASGSHAAVFMRPRAGWRDFFTPPEWPDPVPALLSAQENCERPVQLLPVVVIWRREPARARSSTQKALLGTDENAGVIARLIEVALGHRDALVQVGEPVDLADYAARFAEEPPHRQARRLRLLLRRYLFREQELVRGPTLKTPRWTRRLVLSSPRVRRLIEDEALATRKPVESVRNQVLRTYDKMAARFSYRLVAMLRPFSPWFWSKVYQGADVRPADLERIRQATRRGVCVLVPAHKSHVDYILVSAVLHDNDIVMPHVIAGDNLAFFPMGGVLRRLGAVFIRRSFAGERVFPALFRTYLTHLFREGYTVEFFIEGGRSRTGKLLPPKLGVLGYTVEAGIEARIGRTLGEVTWLPVAITYERILEETPYARELSGRDKRPETFGAFLRALSLIVRRQGRVFLRVGEPLELTVFLGQQPGEWGTLDREHRKEALNGLAERILHRINEAAVLVPTGVVAAALLAQSRPGVPQRVLAERVRVFCTLAELEGAELSSQLSDGQRAIAQALGHFRKIKAVESLTGADDVVHRTLEDKRITLDFYKNGVLHWLLPASLLAAELRAAGRDAFTTADLRASLRFQLFVLRFEFISDPDVDEDTFEARGLAQLTAAGAIAAEGDGWRVIDRARVSELAELTLNFVESYYVCLRGLHPLRDKDLDKRQRVRELLALGRQFLAVEDIRRPEALSSVTLANALRAFEEDGVYSERAGGGLEINGALSRSYIESLRCLMRHGDARSAPSEE
ncbi:MAG: 1-acyl-sn-glycerol-3-phosphate acyltransferase [Alphaproteobacteria bacterium]|nr:1-acyl-sn-glycerol-3-phosphate acyltransferase [Alphaproteobacteria bacterium]